MSFQEPGLLELDHNGNGVHTVTANIGDTPMIFEAGRVAKQASGSVLVRWGDSVVLVTACGANQPKAHLNFFPLTVEYVEKTYAAGKIPGGFFKREARPRAHEVLNARIIDRSIRPLFTDGYRNEVQVIATVISHDGEHDTDVMAMCGASMALHVSDLPFGIETGPIAGVRIARDAEKNLIINPTVSQMAASDIDMFLSMHKDAVVMVEGAAQEVEEEALLEALYAGFDAGQEVIKAVNEMRGYIGKEKRVVVVPEVDEELKAQVKSVALDNGLADALKTKIKLERYTAIDAAKAATKAALEESMGDAYAEKAGEISGYFDSIKKDMMRKDTTGSKVRIDGRAYDTIRNIDCEVGALPRTHGSSLFTRGETQALVTTTLGTRLDEQKLDTLLGERYASFMLHYNFPPFSVGEARMLRSTSRREIGHGMLAQRAIEAVLPEKEDFPYTVRVVSEITESNGSSSMASVCGGVMSLFDAGVPLKAPVAGIAMGLIKEGDDVAILSDILGDEDHLGDMDFKVCGTEKGVTALQMDIKISGLSREIMTNALEQARKGRLHILEEMNKAIAGPRADLSEWAPRIITVQINPEKIRDIIGPGGKMIREITAKTGAKIDINDDGVVTIASVGGESGAAAQRIIEDITREAEVGRVYMGIVKKVVDFGAFVEIFSGTEGLIHISELADKRVNSVSDIVQEGDEVVCVALSVDRDGKIRLSRKRAKDGKPGEYIEV